MSIFCFLISFLILLSCFFKDADVFSPARVFGFVWFSSIGLTDLKLSRLQHQWSAYSWFVISLAVGSFLIGAFVIFVVANRREHLSIREIRLRAGSIRILEDRFFLAILVLSFLYFVSLMIETYAAGGLPIFSSTPEKARIAFGVFGFHLFVGGIPAVLFLIMEYYILVPGNRMKKAFLAILFAALAGSFFFLLVRFTYVMTIALMFGAAYYMSNGLRVKNVIVVLVIVGAMFTIALQVREAKYVENYLYVISQMRYSKTFASLTGPYMYVVMNLENVTRVVDRIDSFTFGYYTFDFILALTGLKHWLADYFRISSNIYLTSGYNTFPFFFYYLQDFGILGVTLFPFGLGVASWVIYHRMRTMPTLNAIALYAFCFYAMVISFFTNPLTMLNFAFVVAAVLFVHLLITPKATRFEQSHG